MTPEDQKQLERMLATQANAGFKEFSRIIYPHDPKGWKRLKTEIGKPIEWTKEEYEKIPDLEGKVFLWDTGTSARGINFSIARLFKEQGAKNILFGSSEAYFDSLLETDPSIEDDYGLYIVDSYDTAVTQSAMRDILKKYGRLDGISFSRAELNPIYFLKDLHSTPIAEEDKERSLRKTIGGLQNLHTFFGPLLAKSGGFLAMYDYAFREQAGYKARFIKEAQEEFAQRIAPDAGYPIIQAFLWPWLSKMTIAMSDLYHEANALMEQNGHVVPPDRILDENTKDAYMTVAQFLPQHHEPGQVTVLDGKGHREKYLASLSEQG